MAHPFIANGWRQRRIFVHLICTYIYLIIRYAHSKAILFSCFIIFSQIDTKNCPQNERLHKECKQNIWTYEYLPKKLLNSKFWELLQIFDENLRYHLIRENFFG